MYCQPRIHELYRGVRGHAPLEKRNLKIGLSEMTYPAFPGSNAINLYVYFVELSVLSLVIHNSRALFSKPFQSQANCMQTIPREVTPHLQPIRVLFHRAIQL